MRKELSWYVVAVLIFGLALLVVSCGGTTQAPAKEPKVEEPKIEEPTVEEPTVEEPTVEEPTVSPTAIPHPIEGREDCQQCHGEDGFKPFPADHAGRSNDSCTACHEPAQ